MRYMFLVYSVEAIDANATPAEMVEAARQHHDVMEQARRHGVLRAADPLRPTSTATTVRKKEGRAITIDGPFAETKEQLAGYYIVDVPDLDQALSWAARCPGASHGVMEVRPLRAM